MPRKARPIDWPSAVAAYAAGASVRALRAEHNVTTHYYGELLRRAEAAGIPRRGHDPARYQIDRGQWTTIRAHRRAGMSRGTVAAMYGVVTGTIARIEQLTGE